MPADDLIVSDTSPLLNLALVDRLDILESQFDAVTAAERVWDELAAGEEGLDALRDLHEREFLRIVEVDRTSLFVEFAVELDEGEAAAIAHAVENDADLLLVDEREGRRVARRHDLDVTGVVGVLLRGAHDGSVDIERELDALRDAGFWLSDELYAEIVESAREG